MAVGYFLGSSFGSGVFNGQVTVGPPTKSVSGLNFVLSNDRMTFQPGLEKTQGIVLDTRYKVGGSGSWERPGSAYLP